MNQGIVHFTHEWPLSQLVWIMQLLHAAQFTFLFILFPIFCLNCYLAFI